MTDVDLLAGTIAAELRRMPDVREVYSPRPGPLSVLGDLGGLLDAVTGDRPVAVVPPVDVRVHDGTTAVETSLGVLGDEGATDVGLAAVRAIRDAIGPSTAIRVRVRIATVG